MSLHLGSSKYDEHTVRKVISKRYFKYLHPLCSICFPGHQENAGLEDKARARAGCCPVSAAPSGRDPFPLRECHPAWLSTAPEAAPRPAPSRSCREGADVLPEELGRPVGKAWMSRQSLERRGAEVAASSVQGGTMLTASAGKAQAESSPLSTVTPTTSVKPLLNLSPWILPLFTRPAHFH